MTASFDVIVIGVGSMGAATCCHLAKRGVRVLGLEQFDIPNVLSSHHGQTRVVRKAYFEHPDYVPLLQCAYDGWEQIEREAGVTLLHRTGGVYMGLPDGDIIGGSLRAIDAHGLPHEKLTRDDLARRYPMFHVPDDFVGLIEADTGFVQPEQCVSALATLALRHGAKIHAREPIRDWRADASGVVVQTDRATYHADRLVVCGGAWSGRILGEIGCPLRVTRQVMGWVWPARPELFAYGGFPVWVIEAQRGGLHYGTPMLPDRPGFKIAYHVPASPTDPDRVDRRVITGDEETFRPVLERFIPDANGPLLSLDVCLYTNTPDGHFILDRHPRHENVYIACGFSGHGFKFVPVIGQAMADLATHGRTDLPIGFLSLSRFGPSRTT